MEPIELEQRLLQLEHDNAVLRQQHEQDLADLRRLLANLTPADVRESADQPSTADPATGRRVALKLLATGFAGAAVGAIARSDPAAAVDPNDISKDTNNVVAGTTSITRAGGTTSVIKVTATSTTSGVAIDGNQAGALEVETQDSNGPTPIVGRAKYPSPSTGVPGVLGSSPFVGVQGLCAFGPGVAGSGIVGVLGIGYSAAGSDPIRTPRDFADRLLIGGVVGIAAQGNRGAALVGVDRPQLRLVPAGGPPTGAEIASVGDLVLTEDLELWACYRTLGVTGGLWRKVLDMGKDMAPRLVLLDPPTRVYDSRATGVGATNEGKLAARTTRTIAINGRADIGPALPSDATAVLATITVTETEGAGFLKLWGSASEPDTSVINWSGPNEDVATTTVSLVQKGANVHVTSGPNRTHLVLDVVGFYH